MTPDHIRDLVRTRYGSLAAGAAASCCGSAPAANAKARQMGYDAADLEAVGEGANLGLGCGNPQAIAALQSGEVVLDLGSGAGFDAFLAARAVGDRGRVIGVDMTHEMLAKARANAVRLGLSNVQFRLGEIEHLPVADASVDVIISNCVINLSPDKPAVFAEAWRVLKPGGRLAVSDVVLIERLPDALANLKELFSGCIAGAATVAELTCWLEAAGFEAINIEPKPESRALIRDWAPNLGVERFIMSAMIEARKPAAGPASAVDRV